MRASRLDGDAVAVNEQVDDMVLDDEDDDGDRELPVTVGLLLLLEEEDETAV